jgi:hypothetical protein
MTEMRLLFRQPENAKLDDGKFLFTSIDWFDDTIVLTASYYFDDPIDYRNVNIKVDNDKRTLRMIASHMQLEPVLLYVINDIKTCGEHLQLKIEYREHNFEIPLQRQLANSQSDITCMTLCLEDVGLLVPWIAYHEKSNVRTFHIYYNHYISEKNWIERLRPLQDADIEIHIIEWNIDYWFPVRKKCAIPMYQSKGYQHHAQIVAINHMLQKAKILKCSKYLLLMDLDEYIMKNTMKEIMTIEKRNGNVCIG